MLSILGRSRYKSGELQQLKYSSIINAPNAHGFIPSNAAANSAS